jgi:hypothetical protein
VAHDVGAENLGRPTERLLKRCKGSKHGGLAGSVGAEDRNTFTGVDGK